MKYFRFEWLLLVVLLICVGDIFAAPKRKAKPKKPIFQLPKFNINIHHNSEFFCQCIICNIFQLFCMLLQTSTLANDAL